jgi:hypothetical protein
MPIPIGISLLLPLRGRTLNTRSREKQEIRSTGGKKNEKAFQFLFLGISMLR